ncbi:patatin-like protein [Caldinitratiruptor microaerophilus]|uniref:PNPLA domain-containing protein n=1 Tax=Caldinitratiruptor microaerophilus TaxID=671077 RepID=A0AA35CLW4_9FIRM|nr:patatin-like protein [Caldinitratiruptor microaerophilus]BDG61607.1 hypothetical protein caldi_26970 [Caldinitratiruptor microaerophilus]
MAGTGEARCELRIGLVLYGGVSLAIYMAGAAQEILRLVRSWPPAAAPEPGRAGEGPYAALLRQASVRPVVDIIAGTSAGGLNGLILAKALACGAPDLAEAGRLWIEKAGAEALLHRPSPEALLRGEYLERQLWRALRRLDRRAEPGLAMQVPVLDLFLTATDLGGVGWEAGRDLGVRDVFGQPVRGRENLLLFHLRKRSPLPRAFPDDRGPRLGYERNDFTAPRPALARRRDRLLARLGRATSAFPVAFPPVRLQRDAVRRGGLPDLWPDDPAGPRERWLTDGGLLLNRPFPPVIRTVFGRVADRPVERVLLYLDPDPEPSGPEPRGGRPGLDRVLAAVAGLPWNEDIRRYIAEVREHNRRVRHYRRALLEGEASAGGPPAAGPAGMTAYRALRRQRLEEYYRTGFGAALVPAEAFLDALLDGTDRNGGPPADLDRLDPPYQQRRLQYLIHLVGTFYPRGGPPGDVAAIGRLEAMLWEVHELWRQVEWEIFHPGALPPGDPLRDAFEALAATSPGSGVPALRALAAAVRRRLKACERAAAERLEQAWQFASGLPGGATAARDGLAATLVRAWAGFAERDVLLFPLAEYGGLGEWDEVEVGRLSPAAPTSIRVQARRKLAGEILAHFGGFLDERWRRSDHMWGRLDTAELLIRLVAATAARHLPPAEAAALAQQVPELVAASHREILVEEAEALDGRALRALLRRLPAGGGLCAPDADRLPLPDLVARAPYEVLREYLERYHRVGEEGVLDLPAPRLARLGYRTIRNLARAVAAAGGGPRQSRFLLIPVALGLWLAGPVVGLGLLAAAGAARWLGRRRPPGADPGSGGSTGEVARDGRAMRPGGGSRT